MRTRLDAAKNGLLIALIALVADAAAVQATRIPVDAVDAFHAALRKKDTAGVLSLLDRGLVVFEFGAIDPTVEAYASAYLPFDIDAAAATERKLETRRVGGKAANVGCWAHIMSPG